MRIPSIAVALALTVTVPAAAQSGDVFYRPGQPAVMEPAERGILARRDIVVDRFRSAYRGAGRPRIALFWNRTFDDRVSAWRPAVRLHGHDQVDLAGRFSSSGRDGDEAARSVDGEVDGSVRHGWSRQIDAFDPTPRRRGLAPADDAGLESGFVQTLGGAGVRILDRAAMMRLLDGGGGSDLQAIEAAALRNHADLLLEVVRTPSPSAALDSVFQIRVKDIGSGRLVASLSSDGEAAAEHGGTRFEPGADGFVRVARPSHELAQRVGEQLALETMDALAGHWSR